MTEVGGKGNQSNFLGLKLFYKHAFLSDFYL
jgi:hypothetical protein